METVTKIAAYHQFCAVKRAVESTLVATGIDGSRKGGMVVDYIGIASDLKRALAVFTESGG